MSDSNDEPNMLGLCAGMAIIMIFFFGGFISMFMFDIWEMGVGAILFFMMGIPMIGAIIGIAIIIKTNGAFGIMRPFLSQARYGTGRTAERSYVHEPPSFCSSCGGSISAENIEWVGPLSVKCPYCGATLPTAKREV
ncbi:MAG: hypothetical protein ACFFEF_05490 [Candidatus Thorarchaeota archaeon]